MKLTPEQLKKASQAQSAEELLALAGENGVELTADEAGKYFAMLHKEGGLADEELENAAGGGWCDPKPPVYTTMRCRKCGAHTSWRGNFVNGVAYKCPMCSANAYYGERTTENPEW